MLDLVEVMKKLAINRHIFHSEADFQHALAWEIHKQWPGCSMRLEYKPPYIDTRLYLDLWASNGDEILAIELKYKTRELKTKNGEEIFDLLDQGAQDLGRYDFLKDIQRLEEIVEGNQNITGYGILLTNDHLYWNRPGRNRTVDTDFRIHDDREIKGELTWTEKASEGTKNGRKDMITLKNSYSMEWKDYFKPSNEKNGKFRYLLVEVTH